MDNNKTQSTNSLGLRPDVDTRSLIKEAIRLSPDPIIRKQTWGWWPRLVKNALSVYLASLKRDAEL